MFDVAWKGIDAANSAIERTVKQTDQGTRAALQAAARLGAQMAKANASGPPRSSSGGRRVQLGPANPDGGPGVVTGRLRRSIRARSVHRGRSGHFSVAYGSFGLSYPWIVARGSSRWERGHGYPFLPDAAVRAALMKLSAAEWQKSIRPAGGR